MEISATLVKQLREQTVRHDGLQKRRCLKARVILKKP